jgi:hypothetical protein
VGEVDESQAGRVVCAPRPAPARSEGRAEAAPFAALTSRRAVRSCGAICHRRHERGQRKWDRLHRDSRESGAECGRTGKSRMQCGEYYDGKRG